MHIGHAARRTERALQGNRTGKGETASSTPPPATSQNVLALNSTAATFSPVAKILLFIRLGRETKKFKLGTKDAQTCAVLDQDWYFL